MPGLTIRPLVFHGRDISLAIVAALAGVVAVFSGASPTGSGLFDTVVIGFGVAFVTWVAAKASWRTLTGAAVISALVAWNAWLIAIALIALVLGALVGTREKNSDVTLSAIAGVTAGMILNVLIRSEMRAFFGLSALVALAITSALLVSGIRALPRAERRMVLFTSGAAVGLMVVATVGFGASALSARGHLIDAVDNLRKGVDLVNDGDIDEATIMLREAAQDLSTIESRMNAPWNQPARIVPVIAQHRSTLMTLSGGATDLIDSIVDELEGLDLRKLKPQDGRINVQEIETVTASADRLLSALQNMQTVIADADSDWLLGPVAAQLDDVGNEVDGQLTAAVNAQETLRLAPAMLGADAPRRYFFLFTTPAEARGSGGFMGNWAEIVVDNGDIELTRTGRTRELNQSRPFGQTLSGPPDFINHFKRTGIVAGRLNWTTPTVWSFINPSPHFPYVGQVVAELYPKNGGQELDGVFSMALFALGSFLEFTGPIQIEGSDRVHNADTIVEFLLYDQYRTTNDQEEADRKDFLKDVTQEVFERLLDGALPDPLDLVDTLSPFVAEGSLMGYATNPEEQALFERLNIAGALPEQGLQDSLTIAFNNYSANKLELFLDVDMTYDLKVAADGLARSQLTMNLANNAPTSGWPDGVIGNYIDKPVGTNRIMVMSYSKLKVVSATFNGEPVRSFRSVEAGYSTADWIVEIPAGETGTLVVEYLGLLIVDEDSKRVPLVLRTPRHVTPVEAEVLYTRPDGKQLTASFDKPGTFRFPLGSENLADE